MNSTNKPAELIVQQGKNVLSSMKDLKSKARKKGRERSKLYERFCANQHSFEIYTFIDPAFENLQEVQVFQQKLDLFREEFAPVFTNYEAEVDVKQVEFIYEEVFNVYNSIVIRLGYTEETVNVKRF